MSARARPEAQGSSARRTGGGAVDSAPPPASLMGRLRDVHLKMVDAVLAGDGLQQVAELAAEAAGGPVAVVVPRLGVSVMAPHRSELATALPTIERYVRGRLQDGPAEVPEAMLAEVPISAGDELVGAVVLLTPGARDPAGSADPDGHASEFLHLAAVASLTEVAVAEAKEEVEQNLRGSLLEDLRTRPDLDPAEVARRAGRLGCDLSSGVVVLCAELTSERPRHVVATICGEYPGALAQHMDGRVYALLPAARYRHEKPAEAVLESARQLAARLQRHGPVGMSSFYLEPAELSRAIQEAELVLEVVRRSGVPVGEDMGSGTYRLLFRVLASHPEEVSSFYEDTVAPLVGYDDQYATDLVGTLESYLAHNCNMNGTAAAIYTHRHTVAYRLDRVRELTGLNPMESEDRERLGLGLKAYRIIAPRLPR
jgi:sugar diacid utilization regulator